MHTGAQKYGRRLHSTVGGLCKVQQKKVRGGGGGGQDVGRKVTGLCRGYMLRRCELETEKEYTCAYTVLCLLICSCYLMQGLELRLGVADMSSRCFVILYYLASMTNLFFQSLYNTNPLKSWLPHEVVWLQCHWFCKCKQQAFVTLNALRVDS